MKLKRKIIIYDRVMTILLRIFVGPIIWLIGYTFRFFRMMPGSLQCKIMYWAGRLYSTIPNIEGVDNIIKTEIIDKKIRM